MIKGFEAETTLTYSQASNMSEIPLSPVTASMVLQNNDMVRGKLNSIFRSQLSKRLTTLKMPRNP